MSDPVVMPARPVSLFTIVFLFAVFAAFLLVIRYFYTPSPAGAFNATPDNMSKDLEWRANAEARRGALAEQRKKEAELVSGYGWVDQQKGVVRLPIDRAMDLTVQQYSGKQSRQSGEIPGKAPAKR